MSESDKTYPYELSKEELLREGVLSNAFSMSLLDFIACNIGVPDSDPSVWYLKEPLEFFLLIYI